MTIFSGIRHLVTISMFVFVIIPFLMGSVTPVLAYGPGDQLAGGLKSLTSFSGMNHLGSSMGSKVATIVTPTFSSGTAIHVSGGPIFL